MILLLKISLTAVIIGALVCWSGTPEKEGREFWAYTAALGTLGLIICAIWAIWRI